MKKNKLSEAKTIAMLNEAEAGVPVTDLCRNKYAVSSSTFYKLKNKFVGMTLPEMKRLRTLELENRRLKAMYADMNLEHKILKEVIEKKYPGLIDEG